MWVSLSTNKAMVTVPTVAAALSSIAAAWIGYSVIRVRRADTKRLEFNDKDWKVDKLAKPVYVVRFINAGGFTPWFSPIMMYIIKKLLIEPPVKKSLKLMKQAESEGIVPPILCNSKARSDMDSRLEEYYDDICASETLTPFGKILNYVGALQCLINHQGLLRLGMKAEVQQEQIKEPVFIVSFSRTGTTILHRTMALDRSRWRNFDVCDMLCPLPTPAARWDKKARQRKAQEATKLVDSIRAVYPGWMECLETMHGIRPAEADEDMIWYSMGLGHMYMDPLMRLYKEMRAKPRGISKMETKEVAEYRYAWLATIMKIHQYIDRVQNKEKGNDTTDHLPWLMKDPNHSAYLPELLKQFPDSRLIFTHRSPAEIVPSLAKLMVIFVSTDFIPGAPGSTSAEMGRETVLRMKHYADGIVSFTKSQEGDKNGSPLSFQKVGEGKSTRRIDFYFKDVVKDIPGTIARIFKQFYPDQPGPSKEAHKAFEQYLEANAREKHGNQRRSLEDFHLTQHDVAFKEYNDLFLSRFP